MNIHSNPQYIQMLSQYILGLLFMENCHTENCHTENLTPVTKPCYIHERI